MFILRTVIAGGGGSCLAVKPFGRNTHCGWNSGRKLILNGILEETHCGWNSGRKLILNGILEETHCGWNSGGLSSESL